MECNFLLSFFFFFLTPAGGGGRRRAAAGGVPGLHVRVHFSRGSGNIAFTNPICFWKSIRRTNVLRSQNFRLVSLGFFFPWFFPLILYTWFPCIFNHTIILYNMWLWGVFIVFIYIFHSFHSLHSSLYSLVSLITILSFIICDYGGFQGSYLSGYNTLQSVLRYVLRALYSGYRNPCALLITSCLSVIK